MYLIRGDYKSGYLYYVDTEFPNHNPYITYSFNREYAMIIKDYKLAQSILEDINDSRFKIYNVCPICKHEYDGYLALSRKENKTPICSECGMKEAIVNFINNQKSQD